MRRVWLLMLSALLVFTARLLPARGEALNDFEQYLSTLAFVHQTEARYLGNAFALYNEPFTTRGCGPASIMNAFTVVFGMTNQDETDQVMSELMRLLSLQHRPRRDGISIDLIERLTAPESDNYPHFREMKRSFGGIISAENIDLTVDAVLERMGDDLLKGRPSLLLGRSTLSGDGWTQVAGLCRSLDEMGRGDALVIAFFHSTGVGDTGAPFRTDDGHWVSVCFRAAEYQRSGTFYLLDSYQKALPGEEPDNRVYHGRYPMATEKNPFKYLYTLSHIIPTVVRCTPNETSAAGLEEIQSSLSLTEEQRLQLETEYRVSLLQPLKLYGRGGLLVCLPGK